jgi:hypothetical protein
MERELRENEQVLERAARGEEVDREAQGQAHMHVRDLRRKIAFEHETLDELSQAR